MTNSPRHRDNLRRDAGEPVNLLDASGLRQQPEIPASDAQYGAIKLVIT